ncbi:MAG: HD domain-containing protein [Candidatus Doudnabacteria bacterium]|nr:HD domain-containing protein [Candidatus Doudnabacteria bacterium]
MKQERILQKARLYIRKNFIAEPTGHDFYHMERVAGVALYIAKQEKRGNKFVIELAALLHDIEDSKFSKTHEDLSMTKKLLAGWGIEKKLLDFVIQIIRSVSFKGGKNKYVADSYEAKVVQDADRLDALGAVGIARCFAYGASKRRPIYDPARKSIGNSLDHFYEKLVLLKGLMKTRTGRILAKERHDFLIKFLDRFLNEWNFKSKKL